MRLAVVATTLTAASLTAALLASCSKPSSTGTSSKDGSKPVAGGERIAVPGGDPPPGGPGAIGGAADGAKGASASGGASDTYKLKPEEGKLAIEAPGEAKAGSEVTAKILVTPSSAFKINTEFPTKLTLEAPAGVTITKAELKAGGPDKVKGDAEAFEEKQLAFAVKLTPAQAGSYTVNGKFKFAVCDKDTCLPKTEPISIVIAAK